MSVLTAFLVKDLGFDNFRGRGRNPVVGGGGVGTRKDVVGIVNVNQNNGNGNAKGKENQQGLGKDRVEAYAGGLYVQAVPGVPSIAVRAAYTVRPAAAVPAVACQEPRAPGIAGTG